MIQLENVTKSFAAHLLLDNISFRLNPKERLGLVGRNGHGKTTLFRMILGEEAPDSGEINIPRNYRIGYVKQSLTFTESTILDEGITALPAQERDHSWKAEKILAGLGFSEKAIQQNPNELSGGFQVRLNLAKALISEPDLLLLDEPTNFLDITSIRWIERYLHNWPHELLLITHDRSFMDKLVTHTIGIHRKKLRKIDGNTAKYYSQIAQDEEVYEKTRLNDERRKKEIEQFITRFRAKARLANMVQSRIKTVQKMEKKQQLEKLKNLEFSFRSLPFAAKTALHVHGLSFGYESGQPLLDDLDITVTSGDRICVIGPNGKGKSTFLKLLAGALTPLSGEILYHPAISTGFFEQTNVSSLMDTRTVEEEILYSNPDVDRQLARNICGAMKFSGDDALKKISVLSGGEKSRVMLGKVLANPVNLLLLDEPTNHLDMESCDSLLAAIDNFAGTAIMVTHNEMFLHALADRLIVFQNDQVEVFDGNYQRFLDQKGWINEYPASGKVEGTSPVSDENGKLSRKAFRKQRSEVIAERSRMVAPLKKRMTSLETKIEKNETELGDLNLAMQQASQDQDGGRIADLSQSIHSCQTEIDRLFEELEQASNEYDRQNVEFENRLKQMEATFDNSS